MNAVAKTNQLSADTNSKFLLKAEITLWGGVLKSSYDTQANYFEFKTQEKEKIKVEEIKIGSFEMKNVIPQNLSSLKELQVEVVIKRKGETKGQTDAQGAKDDFLMLYLSVGKDDQSPEYVQTKKDLTEELSFLGELEINSINIAYASWGEKADVKNIDFDNVHQSSIMN